MNNQNQPLKMWAGLITLYLIWGSTYLGIRFVVESVPPFLASGFRNSFYFCHSIKKISKAKPQNANNHRFIWFFYANDWQWTYHNGG